MRIPLLGLAIGVIGAVSAAAGAAPNSEGTALESPNGELQITFRFDKSGRPGFSAAYRGSLVASGTLGLAFANSGLLVDQMKVVGVERRTRDDTYMIVVGKSSTARDHHHELVVSLAEQVPPHRRISVAFRAFDDGFAFRYIIPEQEVLKKFVLTDEKTSISFPGNPSAHVLPLNSYTTAYEKYYETLPVSGIGPQTLAGLPMLLESSTGSSKPVWLAITEADLTDYAGMYLSGDEEHPATLVAKLSPLPNRTDGAKVVGTTPHVSPWRVIMVADNPGRFIESNLVFHLNEPSAIGDTSWIKPGATTFPWWNGYVLEDVDFAPGVNTATMKHYIEFCAEQGIPYHSLDGLDIAWYGGPIAPHGETDVTTADQAIDLLALLRFAKEKRVRLRLWMHWKALQPQIDEAFRTYEAWGIEGVMVDFMDRDDQEMVRFYHEMASKAAEHHLTLTLHGAYKPTGMERTWPNVLTYEAVLNQEYNKWLGNGSHGTPPEHNLNVAFIRTIAGPLDYHQGGTRSVMPESYHYRDKAPLVQGTRAHQLAMFVVYENHLPMLADYPAAYRRASGFDFMVHVPKIWNETRVLNSQFGNYLVVARRNGRDWYLGGMTGERAVDLNVPLDCLDVGSYRAELYLDDDGSDDPTAMTTCQQLVRAADVLPIRARSGGGFVAKLVRLSE